MLPRTAARAALHVRYFGETYRRAYAEGFVAGLRAHASEDWTIDDDDAFTPLLEHVPGEEPEIVIKTPRGDGRSGTLLV